MILYTQVYGSMMAISSSRSALVLHTSCNKISDDVPAPPTHQAHKNIRFCTPQTLRIRNGIRRTVKHAYALSAQVTDPSDKYYEYDQRPIILFDGVCNLCNGGVNFMLDHDSVGKVRFAALQSPAGRALLERVGRRPDDITSIVLIDKEISYIKSDAILRIAQQMGLPFPLLGSLGLFTPIFFRDFVYDAIADNRYNVMGKQATCRLYDDRFRERFVVD